MSKIHLLDEEKVLASDDVRQFSLGFISFNAECTLTNKRLLLFPKGAMDKITGEKTELFLKSVKNIESKGLPIVHHIASNSGTVRISGTGADRICERLNRLLSKDKSVLSEKVLLQGDADVYIKGRLSTKGELILSNKTLVVRSGKGSLEGFLFKGKELNTPLTDIKNINYEKIEQRLTITAKSGEITLGGKGANRLHAALLSLEGSTLDELEEELKIYKVLHYKGAARAANQGELSFTGERIIFTPSSTIDTMTGATLRYISLDKVTKLSKEKNLLIESAKDALELITSEKDLIFSELIKKLRLVQKRPLFTDIRDKKYTEEIAREQIIRLKFPFKFKGEVPLLIGWCIVYIKDELVYPLWLFMTDRKTRLLNKDYKVVWEASNASLSLVANRRASDPTIQLLFRKRRYRIIPTDGLAFSKFFLKKVKDSKPPESEQFARGKQSVHQVTGSCKLVTFSSKGKPFCTIRDTAVSKQVRGLQVRSERLASFKLKEGDSMEVEVPKADGRFRFTSVISEQYLVEPDPVGRYYITFSIPTEISVYNDRASYRAPFAKMLTTKIFKLPEYDVEREDVENIDPKKYQLLQEEEVLELDDLSVGGCALLLRNSIKMYELPLHQIAVSFELTLYEETFHLIGTVKYQVSNNIDENGTTYRVGLQFFGLNNIHRSIINREVLKIEREQIRKEMENKEIRN